MRKYGFLSASVLTAALVLAGCHHQGAAQNQETTGVQAQDAAAADGNLAPVGDQAQTSPQATNPAPATETAQNEPPYTQPAPPYAEPEGQYPNAQDNQGEDEAGYGDLAPVETSEPPPPLPEYTQPEAPGDNYMWTPGYWYWSPAGYYWVPGTWVLAPYIGALWTPGYWFWSGSLYRFNPGYWGPYVGFYGGIDYGFGYTGRGYYGGYWSGGAFRYNRSVTHINPRYARNVYSRSVSRGNGNRVSYNGGRGGLNARPTASENVAARDRRMGALPAQAQHVRSAAGNRQQFAKFNRGRPSTLAAAKPLATGYKAPAARPPSVRPGQQNRPSGNRPGTNRPGVTRPEATRPNTSRPNSNRTAANRQNQTTRAQQGRPQTRPAAQQPRPERQRPQPQQRLQTRTQEQRRPQQTRSQPQTRPQPQQHRSQAARPQERQGRDHPQ